MYDANASRSLGGCGLPAARLGENRLRFSIGAVGRIALVEAVVRQPSADVVKRLMPPAKGVEKVAELRDVNVRRLPELVDPRIEYIRLMRIHDAIGAERRINLRRQAGCGNLLVIRERIRGIVGGADRPDAEFAQDAFGAELRRLQRLVRPVPHAVCRLLVQQLIDAEVPFQLEVGPVIERIPQRMGHRLRPRLKFLSR